VEDSHLVAKDGRRVRSDECCWCTNARTQQWISDSGLAVDENENGGAGSFMRVNATLESENTRDVFGCGDCANVVPYPRPKVSFLKAYYYRVHVCVPLLQLYVFVGYMLFSSYVHYAEVHWLSIYGLWCLSGFKVVSVLGGLGVHRPRF